MGDCSFEDIDDPIKALANWEIAKETILIQKRIIRLLLQAKRFRKRIR